MSYNIFINSSIWNVSGNRTDITKVLDSVDNPRWNFDENKDIVIEEDFDMRHVEALLRCRNKFR